MEEQFLKNLRNSLERYEKPVPDNLWGNIAAAMEKEKATAPRKRNLWYLYTAIASAAAVLLLLLLLDYPVEEMQKIAHQQEQVQGISTPTNAPEETTESKPIITSPLQMQKQHISQVISLTALPVEVEKEEREEKTEEPTEIKKEEDTSIAVTPKKEKKEDSSQKMVEAPQAEKRTIIAGNSIYTPMAKHHTKTGHVSIGLHASGVEMPDFSMRESANVSYELMDADNPFENVTNDYDSFNSANINLHGYQRIDEVLFSNQIPLQRHAKHKLPMKLGIAFRYPINNRWSIETGVTYTRMESTITEDRGYMFSTIGNATSWNQTLKYIGVPVGITYTAVDDKKVNIYATAAAQLEKCISAESKETDLPHPFQVGFSLTPGVQYNFSKHVGVYVEPGVNCYLDDGTSLLTRYKDKPVDFQLKFGIRVNVK